MEIINFSITASFFILIAVLIRITLAEHIPKIFYKLLWTAVLIKLLIPVSMPSPLSIYNFIDLKISKNPISNFPNEVHFYNDDILSFDVAVINTNSDRTQNIVSANEDLVRIITLSGSIAVAAFVFINHLIYRKKYALSLPCEEKWIIDWVNTHKIRRRYSVRVLETVKSPVTYGIVRPVILLPSHININKNQMEFVLMHEYTHIRRYDVLWKILYFIMAAVHWFNPLVWIAYILMSRDMELSCDEAVINKMGYEHKKAYAAALIDLTCMKNKTAFLFNGFSGNLTKERIRYIMKCKKVSKAGIVMSVIFAICISAVFATETAFAKTNSISEENVVFMYPITEIPEGYMFLSKTGKRPDIDSFPTSEFLTVKCANDDMKLYSACFFQLNIDEDETNNISLFNGESALITEKNGVGWSLTPNDKLTITLNIDLSADYSDKNGEFTSVGYYADSQFVEIFYGKVKDKFEIDFVPPKDGEYYIYLTNLSAGLQNYKEIEITKGEVV